jgi:hypothetical protein
MARRPAAVAADLLFARSSSNDIEVAQRAAAAVAATADMIA